MKEDVKEMADRLIADRRVESAVSPELGRRRIRLLRGSDTARVRSRSAIDCSCAPTIVQQSFRDETDVNVIVRRFGVHALQAHAKPGAVYGDFTGITDFESAMERIEAARAGFELLPAEVRERFGNDPGRFYQETGSMTAEQLEELVPAVQPVKAATLDDVVAAVRASVRPVEGDSPPAVE